MSAHTSSSKSCSSTKTTSTKTPPPIVALPSLSSHLFSLPHAKNIDSLPVHPSQSAQRHAESEAKLKKALERNVARQSSQPSTSAPYGQYPVRIAVTACGHAVPSLLLTGRFQPRTRLPPPSYSEPSSPLSHSPPLMMRKRPNPTR